MTTSSWSSTTEGLELCEDGDGDGGGDGDGDGGDGWYRYGDICFSLLTWQHLADCHSDCLNRGGQLASLHSTQENDFVSLIMER